MKEFVIVMRYRRQEGKEEIAPATKFTASTRPEAEARAKKWLQETHCPRCVFLEFVSVSSDAEARP